MAGDIRRILDTIQASRLRALCEERGLATGGDQSDKRERLARSMRGNLEELIPLLRRSDIIGYLSGGFEFSSGMQGSFARLGQASRQDLETLLRWVVNDDPRARASSRPLGHDCAIRFRREEEDDEGDDGEAGEEYGDAEKVFVAAIKRDNDLMYYIKGGDVWAVPRKKPGQSKGKAVKLVSAGIKMDYSRYVYYLDDDGDIARRSRRRLPDGPVLRVEHGDIVAARWRGELHEPARVLRVVPDTGDVFVHWYDNRFSEVAAEDIVRLSDKPWTLELLGEDEVDPDDLDYEPDLEEEFKAWLAEYFQTRDRSAMLIKTLVNRLGRHRAHERLSTAAMIDVGRVLADAGYDTVPDLQSCTQSPGITARVEVRKRPGEKRPDPAPRPRPPEPIKKPKAALSSFEKAALRLQFLVQNAAAFQRQEEPERRRAVELAARDLSLGAADQIRLRALAHQYAATHTELTPIVTQLREGLVADQRRQLLDDMRELCPPGDSVEALVTEYARDLDVATNAPPEPSPGSLDDSVPAPEPPPVPPETIQAGALRSNTLLDSLFGEEN